MARESPTNILTREDIFGNGAKRTTKTSVPRQEKIHIVLVLLFEVIKHVINFFPISSRRGERTLFSLWGHKDTNISRKRYEIQYVEFSFGANTFYSVV